MTDYTMKIVTNDIDNTQSRIIIEVNGFEIDIIADADGLGVDVQKNDIVHTSLSMDWE